MTIIQRPSRALPTVRVGKHRRGKAGNQSGERSALLLAITNIRAQRESAAA